MDDEKNIHWKFSCQNCFELIEFDIRTFNAVNNRTIGSLKKMI